MTLVYQFNVPAISCEGCIAHFDEKLIKLKKSSLSADFSHFVDGSGVVSIFSEHALTKDQADAIITTLESTLERPVTMSLLQDENTQVKSRFDKPIHYFFLGVVGCAAGTALMLFTMYGAAIPLLAVYGLDVASMLLTLYLGWDTFREGARYGLDMAHTLVTLFSGLGKFREAVRSFFINKSPTMHVLFAINAIVAMGVSVASWFVPGLSSLMYTVLLLFGFKNIGTAVEHMTKKKITSQLKFQDRAPKEVEKWLNDKWILVPAKQLVPGDVIRVKSGIVLPVNGKCQHENALVYEDILTGNTVVPVRKIINDELYAGFRVAEKNHLVMKVTATVRDSYLAKKDMSMVLTKMKKAEIESNAQSIMRYFIPGVLIVAALAVIPFGWASGLNILVGICPCVFGMIVPLAVTVGLEKAASHGADFKNRSAISEASEVNTVMFDMHGTLTMGKPIVEGKLILEPSVNMDEFYDYLYALEQESEHPVAEAIKEFVRSHKTSGYEFKKRMSEIDVKSHHAGIKGVIENQRYIVGNISMMNDNGVKLSAWLQQEIEVWSRKGSEVILLAREVDANYVVIGLMSLSDPLRIGSKHVVKSLQEQGMAVYICTGGSRVAAQAKATQLGIAATNVIAEKSGVDKMLAVKELQEQGAKVGFVGDGGNDTDAMSTCLGVAVRSRTSDPMIDKAASVIINDKNLLPILTVFTVAKQMKHNIYQNLTGSSIYNMGVVVFACTLGCSLGPCFCLSLMFMNSMASLGNLYRFKHQSLPHLSDQSKLDKPWQSSTKLAGNHLPLAIKSRRIVYQAAQKCRKAKEKSLAWGLEARNFSRQDIALRNVLAPTRGANRSMVSK